jgi:phosphate/sulfate permease
MGGSLIMKKLNAMGHNHKPSGGVVSMGVTSGVVMLATEIGVGVSTTQVTASSIMGTSYARRSEILQMMTTWIMTPIASGGLAGIIVWASYYIN